MTNLKAITKTASELGKEAKESVEEFGRIAGKKLDVARDETGDALHAAASTVRTTGRKGSEVIDNFATSAADKLDATASYVEDHDLSDVLTGLRKLCRRHVTESMVAAAVIGFFIGSYLTRSARS